MAQLKRYNGTSWETIGGTVTGDTLPIGSEVDYDGTNVPAGWEQVTDTIESGSNTNGNYVKFSDGTMICTNRVSQTKNIDGQFESSYFTSIDRVNFPQEFISTPYITATLEQNGSLLGFNFTSIDTTSFGAYIWKQQAKSNVTFYIHYIAIGRWK